MDAVQELRKLNRPYKQEASTKIKQLFFEEFPFSTIFERLKRWPIQLGKSIRDEHGGSSRQSAKLRNCGFDHNWIRQELLDRMRCILLQKYTDSNTNVFQIEQKYNYLVLQLELENMQKQRYRFRRQASRNKHNN